MVARDAWRHRADPGKYLSVALHAAETLHTVFMPVPRPLTYTHEGVVYRGRLLLPAVSPSGDSPQLRSTSMGRAGSHPMLLRPERSRMRSVTTCPRLSGACEPRSMPSRPTLIQRAWARWATALAERLRCMPPVVGCHSAPSQRSTQYWTATTGRGGARSRRESQCSTGLKTRWCRASVWRRSRPRCAPQRRRSR